MGAPEMIDVVIYVLVNSEGEYIACEDEDRCMEDFEENGFHTGGRAVRRIELTLKMPAPRALELSAILPPEDGETGAPLTLTVS